MYQDEYGHYELSPILANRSNDGLFIGRCYKCRGEMSRELIRFRRDRGFSRNEMMCLRHAASLDGGRLAIAELWKKKADDGQERDARYLAEVFMKGLSKQQPSKEIVTHWLFIMAATLNNTDADQEFVKRMWEYATKHATNWWDGEAKTHLYWDIAAGAFFRRMLSQRGYKEQYTEEFLKAKPAFRSAMQCVDLARNSLSRFDVLDDTFLLEVEDVFTLPFNAMSSEDGAVAYRLSILNERFTEEEVRAWVEKTHPGSANMPVDWLFRLYGPRVPIETASV